MSLAAFVAPKAGFGHPWPCFVFVVRTCGCHRGVSLYGGSVAFCGAYLQIRGTQQKLLESVCFLNSCCIYVSAPLSLEQAFAPGIASPAEPRLRSPHFTADDESKPWIPLAMGEDRLRHKVKSHAGVSV